MRFTTLTCASIAIAAVGSAVSCSATVRTIEGSGGASTATASSSSSTTIVAASASTTTASSSGTGGVGGSIASSSSSSSSGSALAGPPGPGGTVPPDGTGAVTFAITKLYFGDTDPDGTADKPSGWTHYGYNIDGIPAASTSAFCQPQSGANAASVRQQGIGGIENAWGHIILPIVLSITPDYSSQVNASIAGGDFTFMFTLDKLGMGSSYDPIASTTVQGGNLGATPKLDGTDVWPYLTGTSTAFAKSYVVNDTWVSAPVGSITVATSGGELSLSFPIHHAVISMPLDSAHRTVAHGIISGVLPTAEYQAEIQQAAARLSPSLCSGSSIQAVLTEIGQASDILKDGTQDPTQTCDGISVGLGFDATVVQLGAAQTPVPPADPCGG